MTIREIQSQYCKQMDIRSDATFSLFAYIFNKLVLFDKGYVYCKTYTDRNPPMFMIGTPWRDRKNGEGSPNQIDSVLIANVYNSRNNLAARNEQQ